MKTLYRLPENLFTESNYSYIGEIDISNIYKSISDLVDGCAFGYCVDSKDPTAIRVMFENSNGNSFGFISATMINI